MLLVLLVLAVLLVLVALVMGKPLQLVLTVLLVLLELAVPLQLVLTVSGPPARTATAAPHPHLPAQLLEGPRMARGLALPPGQPCER